MMRYGGRFRNYFSRRTVTHIICSNLPDSQVKNLRAFSRGLPVVKPTWIVDSISANRLLGWVPYQLDQLNDTQPKLSPRSRLTQLVEPFTSCQPETEHIEADEGSSIRVEDSEEARDDVDDESDGAYIENTIPEMTGQIKNDDLKSSEVTAERLGNYEKEEKEVSSELQSTSNLHSASYNKSFHDNRKNDGKSIASAAGSSRRRHSTLEDPNFVENYFKNCLELHDKRVAYVTQIIQKEQWKFPLQTIQLGLMACLILKYVCKTSKDICPQLVIVPYNFEAYKEVADQFYDILHGHCRKFQAVSCEETFLDVEPMFLASTIRNEILEATGTGCSASAGIGGTMLMAGLAGKR